MRSLVAVLVLFAARPALADLTGLFSPEEDAARTLARSNEKIAQEQRAASRTNLIFVAVTTGCAVIGAAAILRRQTRNSCDPPVAVTKSTSPDQQKLLGYGSIGLGILAFLASAMYGGGGGVPGAILAG